MWNNTHLAFISFLFCSWYTIEVALARTGDDIIEFLSEYANYRTSIVIRRYPKRFVRAVANDARKRGHLLLSQHAKKKARDNYYGRDASFLPLSHFSPFLFISPLQATPRCSPIPFHIHFIFLNFRPSRCSYFTSHYYFFHPNHRDTVDEQVLWKTCKKIKFYEIKWEYISSLQK